MTIHNIGWIGGAGVPVSEPPLEPMEPPDKSVAEIALATLNAGLWELQCNNRICDKHSRPGGHWFMFTPYEIENWFYETRQGMAACPAKDVDALQTMVEGILHRDAGLEYGTVPFWFSIDCAYLARLQAGSLGYLGVIADSPGLRIPPSPSVGRYAHEHGLSENANIECFRDKGQYYMEYNGFDGRKSYRIREYLEFVPPYPVPAPPGAKE